MKIKQSDNCISLNQEHHIKNIVSGLEKIFKYQFKVKDTPLPYNFVPTKKGSHTTNIQNLKVKLRFRNLHYRSAIGALLYIFCWTRPDIASTADKLAKFSHNPESIQSKISWYLRIWWGQLKMFSCENHNW